ncbi:MAG: hypothetical protein M1838_002807 [Thelocarpon superellum]|nr:MAG: hypothetical protein M1838_002807 [Thelocarpon superellum]
MLVDYSDSGSSEGETAPAPKPVAGKKSTFQKVVDRSNPHKIRVDLAGLATDDTANGATPPTDRPAKRARTGGGAFSGFNDLLPAPKRTGRAGGGGDAAAAASGSRPEARSRGLGNGVSLKTGATPGFSREPEPAPESGLESGARNYEEHYQHYRGGPATLEGSPPEKMTSDVPTLASTTGTDQVEVKKTGKSTMFKPLSVARNAKKKKPVKTGVVEKTLPPHDTAQASSQASSRPSLFSLNEDFSAAPTVPSTGNYHPMIYRSGTPPDDVESPPDLAVPKDGGAADETSLPPGHDLPSLSASDSQSLDTIADDLNLTAAARRQLFGRQKGAGAGPMPAAVKVINFNTDQEYAANESLRASGDTVQHNPVRAIAPGKHSLKQLLGAASAQKEALEEHFASGRRNKKEAGSRYGW